MVNKKNLKKCLKKLKKNGINVIIKEPITTVPGSYSICTGTTTTISIGNTTGTYLTVQKPTKPEDLIIYTDDLKSDIYTKVEYKLEDLRRYKISVKKFKQFDINKDIKNIINEVYK